MKNNLNNLKVKCTGCFLCQDVCPTKAISIIEDKEGFYKYVIDETKCIDCRLCVKMCPKMNFKKENKEISCCYSAYSKDEEIVKNSSSGGIFSELAKYILKNNGIVIGAAWEKGRIHHIAAETEEELKKLRGSKYLQSNLEGIYIKTKKYLEEGKKVLFSGTPCQIAALNNFIKHDNLYTLDVICHGVPSQKVFERSIKDRFNDKLITVNFRDKSKGWKNYCLKYNLNKKNKTKLYNEDSWFIKFLDDSLLKLNCYNCEFTSSKRIGDISLGDFWGIETIDKEFYIKNKNRGVSQVFINNSKGKDLFSKIKKEVIFKEQKNIELIIKHNIRISSGKYPEEFVERRKTFFENLFNNNYKFKDKLKLSKFVLKIKNRFSHIKNKIRRKK